MCFEGVVVIIYLYSRVGENLKLDKYETILCKLLIQSKQILHKIKYLN